MMHVQAQQRAGKGAAEVIQNFDVIMRKCMLVYRNSTKGPDFPNGLIPRKIIYYRDGVGEGQFPEVIFCSHCSFHFDKTVISFLLDFAHRNERHSQSLYQSESRLSTGNYVHHSSETVRFQICIS